MHHDEMTSDEFDAAFAAGIPVDVDSGPRPVLVTERWSGMRVSDGHGGGVLTVRAGGIYVSPKVPVLAG